MARIRAFARHHRHDLLKTASYYLLHMVVAVAYFFHEKAWARRSGVDLRVVHIA